MKGWALMYHRVVPRRPDTAAYFARGTAVEPAIFAAQIDWLLDRHAIFRPCDDAVDGVILTFDDGYRDVMDHVWPLCRARGLRFAIYPAAGHLADSPHALWFDDYYDRLARARWDSRAVARRALDVVGLTHRPVPAEVGLRWWVRGLVKAQLRDAGAHRDALLDRLGEALDTHRDETLPQRLYLGRADLRNLRDSGVEIGGHGHEHQLHAGLPDVELTRELMGATDLLDRLEVGARRSYCYPDGSVDDRATAAVGRHFSRAFTVVPGRLDDPNDGPFRLPRCLVRNLPPDDPRWCDAMLDPDFTRPE